MKNSGCGFLKKGFALALSLLFFLSVGTAAFASQTPELRFRTDGSFKILQLTDTQDDAYPAWDMLNLLREAVKTADPDLIVITGDLVEDSRVGDVGVDAQPGREGVVEKDPDGTLNVEKTRANVEKAVDAVFSVLEEYEIPYVIALGNNDRKVGLSTGNWLEIFANYPHCVAFDESPDPQEGLDYHVMIRGTDGADKFNVWLMDTRGGGIANEQVDWYRETSQAIAAANGAPVPALAFQHIQAADIGNLFLPCSPADTGAKKTDDGYVRLNPAIAGGYNFFGYTPGAETYEFGAWKECGDVLGAFFGHQHVEGFSGVWNGIELGFTYGCEMAKPGPYGFRVFTLHEEDPANYENVLYRYTGSVKLGTVRVTAENTAPAEEKDAGIFTLLLRFVNLFRSLFSALVHLFA